MCKINPYAGYSPCGKTVFLNSNTEMVVTYNVDMMKDFHPLGP